MSNLNRKSQRQRGQAVVLVALMMVALVAFAGLALDGAQVYMMRRGMQNAADAGALAGANEMGNKSPSGVIASKVHSYTMSGGGIGNGADSYTAVYLPSGNDVKTTAPATSDNCIRVTARANFPTFLIGLIGFDTLDAAASAKVCAWPLSAASPDLWPMLIQTPTTPLTNGLSFIFNDGTSQSGGFGWADFDGGNNSTGDTLNWLQNPFGGPWSVFDWDLNASECNQSMAQYFSTYIQVWRHCISGDPGASATQNIENAVIARFGNPVDVLVYDTAAPFNNGAGAAYHIVGFARFIPRNVCLRGNCCNQLQQDYGWKPVGCSNAQFKWVIGEFIGFVEPGQGCDPNVDPYCYDAGVYTIQMVY